MLWSKKKTSSEGKLLPNSHFNFQVLCCQSLQPVPLRVSFDGLYRSFTAHSRNNQTNVTKNFFLPLGTGSDEKTSKHVFSFLAFDSTLCKLLKLFSTSNSTTYHLCSGSQCVRRSWCLVLAVLFHFINVSKYSSTWLLLKLFSIIQ